MNSTATGDRYDLAMRDRTELSVSSPRCFTPKSESITGFPMGYEVSVYALQGDVFAEMRRDGRACELACGGTEIGALAGLREKLAAAFHPDMPAIHMVDELMGQLLHLPRLM